MLKIVMQQPAVLNNDFRVSGNREDELKDVVEAMDNMTSYRLVDPATEVSIVSVETDKPSKGMYTLRTLIPSMMESGDVLPRPVKTPSGEKKVKVGYFGPSAGHTKYVSRAGMLENGISETQMAEIEKTGFCLNVDDGMGLPIMYIPFDQLLPTFCRYAKTDTVSEEPDIFRDMYLARKLRQARPCGMVFRSVGGIHKAMAFVGTNFRPIPQVALLQCAERILDGREYEVMHWSIDHNVTMVEYRLKKPVARRGSHSFRIGFHAVTSDIGDAAFRITPTAWVDGSMILLPFVTAAEHTDAFNMDAVCSRAAEDEKKARETINGLVKAVSGLTVANRKVAMEEFANAAGLNEPASIGKKRMATIINNTAIKPEPAALIDVVIWGLLIPKDVIQGGVSFSSLERILKAAAKMYKPEEWLKHSTVEGGDVK